MLTEYRPEIGVGDRVRTKTAISGSDYLDNQDFVPENSYGTVVGTREPNILFVNFDEVLHLVKRKVVYQKEVAKVFPTSFVRTEWHDCPWTPTGGYNGNTSKA